MFKLCIYVCVCACVCITENDVSFLRAWVTNGCEHCGPNSGLLKKKIAIILSH